MSFENLVNILPIGFESKKTTFPLITLSVILKWIFVELLSKIVNIVHSRNIESKIEHVTRMNIVRGKKTSCCVSKSLEAQYERKRDTLRLQIWAHAQRIKYTIIPHTPKL